MKASDSSSVLIVAAHPDDEVIGCGGTIARMAAEGRSVHVLLLADGEGSRDASDLGRGLAEKVLGRDAAASRAGKVLGCATVETLGLPDNRLDGIELLDIVKAIEKCLRRYRPAIVLTHHSGDVNIDHRVVHDAVIAACRPLPDQTIQQLLFFEVVSSTEWRPPSSAPAFVPNWFVNIGPTLAKKREALQVYATELRPFPHPRSIEGIEALARWRGATVGVEAAEAFVLGRSIQK